MEIAKQRGIPSWLEVDQKNFKGILKSLPMREDLPATIKEQMIVELYSK